jgi:hypothetical protein
MFLMLASGGLFSCAALHWIFLMCWLVRFTLLSILQVRLGKNGVEEVLGLGKLSTFEKKGLENLKGELKFAPNGVEEVLGLPSRRASSLLRDLVIFLFTAFLPPHSSG